MPIHPAPQYHPRQLNDREIIMTDDNTNCGSSSATGFFSAIPRLLLVGRSTLSRRRRDVLIEPEEVRRVVATLDRGEPIPGRPRVGLADPPLALVAEKVDVHTRVTLA